MKNNVVVDSPVPVLQIRHSIFDDLHSWPASLVVSIDSSTLASSRE